MDNSKNLYVIVSSYFKSNNHFFVFGRLTMIFNLIIFHIQLADDITCAVAGEAYNPSTKICQCGSGVACTVDTSGALRIIHQSGVPLFFL